MMFWRHRMKACSMVCSISRTLPGQGYLRKAFKTSEDIASIVFLNVTTTLMLHATLFLFKSTTSDGTQPAVSVYIHYLKGKCYSSKYTGHRFCSNIKQYRALVEGRIGAPECLSGKIENGYGTKNYCWTIPLAAKLRKIQEGIPRPPNASDFRLKAVRGMTRLSLRSAQ